MGRGDARETWSGEHGDVVEEGVVWVVWEGGIGAGGGGRGGGGGGGGGAGTGCLGAEAGGDEGGAGFRGNDYVDVVELRGERVKRKGAAGVVENDVDEIVAYVALLVDAARVVLGVCWHHGCDVEDKL